MAGNGGLPMGIPVPWEPFGPGAVATILKQRLADVQGVSLRDILAAEPRLRSMSPPLRELLLQQPITLDEPRLAVWADRLTAGMTDYVTRQFQYVDLRLASGSLEQLYRRFLREFCAAGADLGLAQAALRLHQERLANWVGEQLEAVGALELVRRTGFKPVCGFYSPQLQLAVLGLDADNLQSPVLDLGCGDGQLVYHLRSLGYEAVGIDRNAPPGLIRGDWFDAPLEPLLWGTIIAHQSVSLHFMSAHLQSEQRAAEYAKLSMRILRALRPGGSFAYAPTIPFFEAVLPSQFRREHTFASGGVSATRLTLARF